MNAANHPAYDADLLDTLSQRVMVSDDGSGSIAVTSWASQTSIG